MCVTAFALAESGAQLREIASASAVLMRPVARTELKKPCNSSKHASYCSMYAASSTEVSCSTMPDFEVGRLSGFSSAAASGKGTSSRTPASFGSSFVCAARSVAHALRLANASFFAVSAAATTSMAVCSCAFGIAFSFFACGGSPSEITSSASGVKMRTKTIPRCSRYSIRCSSSTVPSPKRTDMSSAYTVRPMTMPASNWSTGYFFNIHLHSLANHCKSRDFSHPFPSNFSKTTKKTRHAPCTSSLVSKDTILILPFVFRSRKSPSIV